MEKPATRLKLIAAIKNDGDKSVTVSISHWLSQMTPRIMTTMADISNKIEKIGSGIFRLNSHSEKL